MTSSWNKFQGRPHMRELVLSNSEQDGPIDISRQWTADLVDEDEYADTTCVCGNHGLRYLYMVENNITGASLYPVGSVCVLEFENEYMDRVVEFMPLVRGLRDLERYEQTFEDAREKGLLTRKFIDYLDDEYAIPGQVDFLKDMFNRKFHGRGHMSRKQKYRADKVIEELVVWAHTV